MKAVELGRLPEIATAIPLRRLMPPAVQGNETAPLHWRYRFVSGRFRDCARSPPLRERRPECCRPRGRQLLRSAAVPTPSCRSQKERSSRKARTFLYSWCPPRSSLYTGYKQDAYHETPTTCQSQLNQTARRRTSKAPCGKRCK